MFEDFDIVCSLGKIVVALEAHGQISVCESGSVYFSLMISRSKMTSRLSLLQCEIILYNIFTIHNRGFS